MKRADGTLVKLRGDDLSQRQALAKQLFSQQSVSKKRKKGLGNTQVVYRHVQVSWVGITRWYRFSFCYLSCRMGMSWWWTVNPHFIKARWWLTKYGCFQERRLYVCTMQIANRTMQILTVGLWSYSIDFLFVIWAYRQRYRTLQLNTLPINIIALWESGSWHLLELVITSMPTNIEVGR